MSFITLNRIINRPTEQYYLLEKYQYQTNSTQTVTKDEIGNIIKKDDVGNISNEWINTLELKGVIQHRQKNRISNAGEESKLRYYGYFEPTFHLDNNKLDNYRVKFVREYETLYLRILHYDPNNYLRHKQHHIVLVMDEDKKYYGRQE